MIGDVIIQNACRFSGDIYDAGELILWIRIYLYLSNHRWNGLNKNGGTVEAFDDAEYSAVYFHYLIMEKHLLREMRR